MVNRQHLNKKIGAVVISIILLWQFFVVQPVQAAPVKAETIRSEAVSHTNPVASTDMVCVMVADSLSGQSYTFSISAQATYRLLAGGTAVDPNYDHNVRVYWAWVSPANRNLSVLQTIDLQNFEGVWQIPAGTSSAIDAFGPWDASAGMRKILIGSGIMGGGACNATSMLRYVLAQNGITSQATGQPAQQHPYIAGVPTEYYTWVCNCTYREDLVMTNPYTEPVYMHWQVVGDTLTLWVNNDGSTSGGVLPPSAPQPGPHSTVATPSTNELPEYTIELDIPLMSEDTNFPPVVDTSVVQPTVVPTAVAYPSSTENSEIYVAGGNAYPVRTWGLFAILALAIILVGILIRRFPK